VDAKTYHRTFHGGFNTFVVFVDGYSHFYWVFWMKVPDPTHHEVFLHDILKQFYQEVCLPRHWLRFTLHPDNAGMFTSHAVADYCTEMGIHLDPSIPHEPSSNGLAEAAVKILHQAGAVSVAAAGLHSNTLIYGVNQAAHVHNTLPHGPDGLSPSARSGGTITTGNDIRTFGSAVTLFDEHHSTARVEAPGHNGRFLQYKDDHHTKIIALDEDTNVINDHGTANVQFNETNVEALIPDLDINEELEAMELVRQAAETVPPAVPIQPAAAVPLDPDPTVMNTSPPVLTCEVTPLDREITAVSSSFSTVTL
jgi:hypothetical protein